LNMVCGILVPATIYVETTVERDTIILFRSRSPDRNGTFCPCYLVAHVLCGGIDSCKIGLFASLKLNPL
jgi:hypothetical protein